MKILTLHCDFIRYEPLKKASITQLKDYKLICMNTGIEWESIDYHLNIESMLELSLKNVA